MSQGHHYMVYQTHDIYKFIDWWFADLKPSPRPPFLEWEDGYLNYNNDVSVVFKHLSNHHHNCDSDNGNYFVAVIASPSPGFLFYHRNTEHKIIVVNDNRLQTYLKEKDRRANKPIPAETVKLNQELPNGAVRANSDKTRLSLVPPIPVEEIGRVFTYGAKKYSQHNWNKGFPWLSVYDSLLRHLSAWHQGQDIDPESGLLHLAHAGCNLMMLIDFHKNNIGVDNRWRYNDSSSPSTDNP